MIAEFTRMIRGRVIDALGSDTHVAHLDKDGEIPIGKTCHRVLPKKEKYLGGSSEQGHNLPPTLPIRPPRANPPTQSTTTRKIRIAPLFVDVVMTAGRQEKRRCHASLPSIKSTSISCTLFPVEQINPFLETRGLCRVSGLGIELSQIQGRHSQRRARPVACKRHSSHHPISSSSPGVLNLTSTGAAKEK